jgi:SAM-dependent methyltransferase
MNGDVTPQDRPLCDAFGEAAPAHFTWQTRGAFVADEERALVRAAFLPLGGRVLDLGCGEGATLYHLGEPEGAVGVDLFEAKVAFAREALPRCRFTAASALELPFPERSFDHVLVRDVIHHVPDASALVAECRRVLDEGGRIDVLEPCRYNPLIAAHGLALKVERGELRSTERFLRSLFPPPFEVVAVSRHQPLPIHRLLFHPDLGRPALAERPLVRAAVGGLERLAGALLPRGMWAYLHLRVVLR